MCTNLFYTIHQDNQGHNLLHTSRWCGDIRLDRDSTHTCQHTPYRRSYCCMLLIQKVVIDLLLKEYRKRWKYGFLKYCYRFTYEFKTYVHTSMCNNDMNRSMPNSILLVLCISVIPEHFYQICYLAYDKKTRLLPQKSKLL